MDDSEKIAALETRLYELAGAMHRLIPLIGEAVMRPANETISNAQAHVAQDGLMTADKLVIDVLRSAPPDVRQKYLAPHHDR